MAGETPASGQTPGIAAGLPWHEPWLSAHAATKEFRWGDAVKAHTRLLSILRFGDEPLVGLRLRARLGRGRARLKQSLFDQAIEDFAVARERWPELLEPTLLLAKAYWLKGNPAHAEELFADLYNLERSAADATATLIAAVYGNLGDKSQAFRWTERISPTSP